LRLAAASVLGALTVMGFSPFGVFPLPLLTLAALFALWDRAASTARAAALGLTFGLGYFVAGVSWVYVSMHDFGGMPAPLAAFATVAFCVLLAIFPAAAAAVHFRLRTGRAAADTLVAAAAWTLAEWVRGWVLTGFPWLALGYSQGPPSPLSGYAPIVGVYGLSFLTAVAAASLSAALSKRDRIFWAGAAVLGIAAIGVGLGPVRWTRAVGPPLPVSLLQGNIEQSLKWRPERLQRSLDVYLDLTQRHAARLIVFPETALPAAFDQLPATYIAALSQAAGPGNDILLGTVIREDGRYYNSAVALPTAGLVQRYDKSHLVPFGEFTPPLFSWTLRVLNIPMSDFARGARVQRPLALAGVRVAVNICYEDVFGEEIIKALPEATLLANLSNTAWFGDSLAQPQHLQIAQLRALETGRYMLRATNTGMTAVVDPTGTVIASLPPFTSGALQAQVRSHEGATPYVRWGNAPVLGLIALILAAAAYARRRFGAATSPRPDKRASRVRDSR